jgi:hypothetical protein
MSTTQSGSRFTPIKIGILVLGLFTALVHLVVLNIIMVNKTGSIDIKFTMNGLGYLALLAVYFIPAFAKWQKYTRWLLVGFTIVTIIAFFIFGSLTDPLGIVTKLVEVGLIILLILDGRKSA